jgi:hypothetical protein
LVTDLRAIKEQRSHPAFGRVDAMAMRQFDFNVGFAASLHGREGPLRVELPPIILRR